MSIYNILLCGKEKDTEFIYNKFIHGNYDPTNYVESGYTSRVVFCDDKEIEIKALTEDKVASINDEIDAYIFIINIKDTQSLNELSKSISNKKTVKDLPMVIIAYPGEERQKDQTDLIPLSKYEEIEKLYHCPVFEVISNRLSTVDEPFFTLIQKSFEPYDIVSRERMLNTDFYDDPFDDKGKFNIGLFGCSFKINLMFRYMYGQYYQPYCASYKQMNFSIKLNQNLSKIVEFDDQFIKINLVDSTLSKLDQSNFEKVKGSVFVFTADIDKSLNRVHEAIDVAEKKLGTKMKAVIAALHEEQSKRAYPVEIYNELEEKYHLKVFEFSLKTGKNVDELFNYLLNIIFEKVPPI